MCQSFSFNKAAGLVKFLLQNTSCGYFSNSFLSKGEDNLVTIKVGSLNAWIGVVTIN